MECLISGGCGFIGSNLVDRLVEDGHKVIVIDDLSAQANEEFYFNDKADYYKFDIRDYAKIEPLFKGIDYVFHLAARSRIQISMQTPIETAEINFIGTTNILEASVKHKVKRVMFSSTSAVYGNNKVPLKETMYPDCLNQYSASKFGAEMMAKVYYKLFGLETIIFRYFNVYGPREPKKGQYAPIIGLFERQNKAGQPLTIVGDGKQRRDFTHVSDVVEANIKAMKVKYNPDHCVFNIGTGKNYSIIEIAKSISDKIKFIPVREGEARETLADNSEAWEYLGWKPKVKFEL